MGFGVGGRGWRWCEDGGGVESVDVDVGSEGIAEINMESLLRLSCWDECCDAAAVEP